MAEFSDSASFGVSDTGLSRYQTPDPIATPLSAIDAPYHPSTVPLTEWLLSPYSIKHLPFVEGIYKDVGAIGKGAETYKPAWYQKPDGHFFTAAEIQESNASVLAGLILDNKQRTAAVQRELALKGVSRETLDLAYQKIPAMEADRAYASQWAYRREILKDIEGSGVSGFFMAFGAMAVTVVYPPAGALIFAGLAANQLARTVERQVDTGRVTVGDVVGEGLSLAAIAGGASSAYGQFNAPPATTSLPEIPTTQFPASAPRPMSGVALSFSQAVEVPLTGNQFQAMSLGIAPIPGEIVGTRFGINTAQLIESAKPTLLEQAGRYVKENPVEIVEAGSKTYTTGRRTIESLLKGDWAGAFGSAFDAAGLPVQWTPTLPDPIRQAQRPLRLNANAASLGGGYAVDLGPADPASKNLFVYLFGGVLLLFVVYGILKKG